MKTKKCLIHIDGLSIDIMYHILSINIFKKWKKIFYRIKTLIKILGYNVIMLLKLPYNMPEINDGYLRKQYLMDNCMSMLPKGLNVCKSKDVYFNNGEIKLFKYKIIFDNNTDKYVSKYPGGSVIWDNNFIPRMSLLLNEYRK